MSKQSQIQSQKQAQLQFLDNGIHRLIIALERLEGFLAVENQKEKTLKWVAVNTERDLHNDKIVPPTKQGFYSETHLHVLNISKQGRFGGYMDGSKKFAFEDEAQLIDSSASHFLNDIFEWYSPRANEIPDDIERFAVPVIAAIADKKLSANDIDALILDYVGNLNDDLSTQPDEYKETAIIEGFTAWTKAAEKVAEEMKKFEESGMNVQLTSHTRGDAQIGYLHLKKSFEALFAGDKGKIAVLLLEKHTKKFCPKLYASLEGEEENNRNNGKENNKED
jgi:hypothetical protein